MKQLKLTLLLILFVTGRPFFAQTDKITVKAADTINYMYLSSARGYTLKKIMDLKNTVPQRAERIFFFRPEE